jgi:archaellum component FlaF (FlaF/FlaG flagellin family)
VYCAVYTVLLLTVFSVLLCTGGVLLYSTSKTTNIGAAKQRRYRLQITDDYSTVRIREYSIQARSSTVYSVQCRYTVERST